MQVLTPSVDSPPRTPLWAVPLSMLAGAALGVVYGAVLRLWMRFVTDDPEFSWGGTLFIVGAFTVSFAMVGLVAAGRRRGWKAVLVPARIAAIIVSLSCFGGAGLLMLPTIVLGSLARARTDWPTVVRWVLGALSAASILLVFGDPGDLSIGRFAVAVIWYIGLVLVEIRVLSEPYRPTVARLPMLGKVLSVLVPAAAVAANLLATVGFATSG